MKFISNFDIYFKTDLDRFATISRALVSTNPGYLVPQPGLMSLYSHAYLSFFALFLDGCFSCRDFFFTDEFALVVDSALVKKMSCRLTC